MLYGKDLKAYEDLDVDTLLARLTAEELEELNNEVDPDVSLTSYTTSACYVCKNAVRTLFQNSLLPPSQRCRDQTTKEPTGPYKREKLLKYLEEKAKTEKDWDEKVPYQPGTKRGMLIFGISGCSTKVIPKRLVWF